MTPLSQLSFDQAMVTMALGLARVTPALMFLPMLGEKPMGRGVLRTTLLTLITLGLLPVLTGQNLDVTALSLPATLLKEGLIGLILGLMLGAPYFAATTFGEFLDNQRGATIAKSIDPTVDVESSLLGSFIGFLWAALFFAGGGLVWIISTIAESYRRIPLDGSLTLNMQTILNLGSLLGQTLMAGVVAAAPAVAVMLLIDIMLGILSRFASQLNPFSLALTVKSLAASVILLLYLSPWTFTGINRLHQVWRVDVLFAGSP
ncbi:type III secretion system export apparatus subunit SctT [Achromobacter xylosoxidans]|uniref:type III secretion system export apparatus subunit SctT n=1 Tax=Alcaligenes xylosoxydans xylosoxydans TaxID=85698 RepID=UPI0022B897FD|nr:type III secretion system export apparatus subunit SctT [Achromobacter xylosoxidans]MCZ8438930.1 type III secretion system export apparatus subunit SctT [Achromobacter xylosoxidans]